MDDPIKCKRIIDGRTYNTETATLLGRWKSDDEPIEEAFFKTRHGAYFLYIFLDMEPDEWIKPLAPEEAQRWMEQHCRADTIEAEFGEMPEAGDPEARITLRIPETLRKRIVAAAEARGQSLNAWIQRCIERCVSTHE